MRFSFTIRFITYCVLMTGLSIGVFSCDQTSQVEKDIAAIPVDITIERFDKLFAKTTLETLPKLKEAYPFIVSPKIADSIWISTLKDTLQQQLFKATETAFPDNALMQDDIESLFQHLKYYDATFKIPRVITVTSNVEYRNKVIVTDSIVLIALDTYLGPEHEFYANIPQYTSANFKASQIAADLGDTYAKGYAYQTRKKTLLDEMVYHGKLLYFKDRVIPFLSEAERIGYTQQQLDWCAANESYIWRYFIERELLYNTDSKLPSRFINPAPFSKFYLEDIDNESPGRVGQYIGWQIVKAYMDNTDTSLLDMMQKEAEDIFNKANFKPRK